jgi:hypothetical protein
VLNKLFGKSVKAEGKPKGSEMAEETVVEEVATAPRRGRPPKKRGPGRPKGSGKKKPGRPKGSGKRGPGRPKGKTKKKAGRPKGSGRKPGRKSKLAKGGVTPLQAKRIAKDAVKAFKAKLPGIIRRELKKLL